MVSRISADPYSTSVGATLESVGKVSEADCHQAGVCGHWSIKDILANLAFWDGKHADRLEARRNGKTLPSDDRDGDVINEEQRKIRSGWSFNDVMNEVNANRNRLEMLLVDPGEAPDEYHIHEHWDEHHGQIREWIGKRG